MTLVDLRLLGAFTVSLDGRVVATARWEHRRAADLVALLGLTPGHRMLRDRIVDALWPELAPDAGMANLHKAAHHARRALRGPEAVVLRSGLVSLFPDARVDSDVMRFEEAARTAMASGDRTVCAAAADLYTGDLLPDRLYDEWTGVRREQLRHQHLELLRGAIRWADVVAAEPTDEAAHRALMRHYLDHGNRHAALRQYQRLRTVLAGDLGVRPAPETVAVHGEIVTGLARAARRPTAPLVGREVALARLGAALRAAGPRGRPALLVTGEAGIGKSRLCEAFCTQARRAGFAVLRGSGAESETIPYGVIRQAARSAGPELVDGLPDEARAVLAGSSPAEPPSRQQLLAALDRLCAGAERGTVLLVDDAHLADDDSVALLDTLLFTNTSRCAVLLALRPEQARPPLAALRSAPSTTEVALPPLGRDESHELVTALCGDRPDDKTLERVWQRAAGNPFFTTELAAALAGGGPVEMPPTLTAAVTARLAGCSTDLVDRLRRVATVLADTAANDAVDADEFTALTGLDAEAALSALDEALATGVLVVDDDGYRFRHALVAHSLADGIAPHRRREIHRNAAETLAATGAHPGRVARHLLAGGQPHEAVPWLVRAAQQAGAVSAYADALGHVEAALAVEPDRADLLALRAEFLLASGDPMAAVAFGAAAGAATGAMRDALRIGQSWALLMGGDVGAATETLDGIIADDTTRFRFTLTSGMIAWFTGSLDEAGRAAEATMKLATATGEQADLLNATFLQALVAHSRGRWAQQFRIDVFDPRLEGVLAGILSDAHLCAAEIYLFGDDGPDSIATTASRLADTAASAGAARGVAFATTLLGEAKLLSGDLDAAEEHLLDGVARHRAVRARGGEAVALHRLAELALAAGRHEAAGPLLDQALEAARFSPLSARHLLARIYGTRVRAAGDDAAALAVMAEAQECMVRPDEVCPADRVPYLVPAATVLARTGQLDGATEMLGIAETLVGLLWQGHGSWAAAVTEARAQVARARGDDAAAHRLLAAAEQGFARAGQPLEAARCRRAGDVTGVR
ncbi:MAG: AAA family ATPase [Pseudonocardiaceae bacterium]|nr:AAA family ATPase [Pseudonocardiaceae bacterium]